MGRRIFIMAVVILLTLPVWMIIRKQYGPAAGSAFSWAMTIGVGWLVYRFVPILRDPSDITKTPSLTGARFDPTRYWSTSKGIFLGLAHPGRSPVYIPTDLYRERHMQIIGPTGSGKGVLLGNLAAQAVAAGTGLVVIDPKRDEFLPRILADACERAGRTLHIVDLQEGRPGGWQPFRSGRAHERVARAIEAFDLNPSGSTADFYKIEGKELLTRLMSKTDGSIAQALAWLEEDEQHTRPGQKLPGLLERNYFKIWGRRKNLNPPEGGFNLNKALAVGDVVYLRSDPNDPELTIPLRAFLMQIAQWKFAHPDSTHLTIIADEVSLYASPFLAQMLATIRATRTNVILAYQSLTDLEAAASNPSEGRIIRQRIDQNCQLKAFYGSQDNVTVETVEEMSGTRQVWRHQRNGSGLRVTHGRAQVEEALIPANLIRRLGQGVALWFEPAQQARLIVTAPVVTKRKHDLEGDGRFYGMAADAKDRSLREIVNGLPGYDEPGCKSPSAHIQICPYPCCNAEAPFLLRS
jgi:hypothetical protein